MQQNFYIPNLPNKDAAKNIMLCSKWLGIESVMSGLRDSCFHYCAIGLHWLKILMATKMLFYLFMAVNTISTT